MWKHGNAKANKLILLQVLNATRFITNDENIQAKLSVYLANKIMPSKNINSSINPGGSKQKLLLFDLSIYGHHPSYIQHFIEHWSQQKSLDSLDIVVSPKFLQAHADVVEKAKKCNSAINFVAISAAEEANLKARKSSINRNIRAFQEWDLLCEYATSLQANKCLIMYFDTCLLPLALGRKSPCSFSGIYFRPTFHYSELSNYLPSRNHRFQQWREKFILKRVLRRSSLQTLFCLDPFAIKYINSLCRQAKAVHLQDPVILPAINLPQTNLKQSLEIDNDRQVFLLFGALNGRKGIYQLLDAIVLLPREICQKLCLLFVGEANPTDKALIEAKIKIARQAKPIQIITQYEFVSDLEVQAYFQLTDVVLAPYQHHVGMSGILLLAAAAQKPVLTSNYGLMGELVGQYSLGVAVDSTIPEQIAQGLTHCLVESTDLGDRTKMLAFAAQNSPEKFAQTLIEHM